MKIYTRNGDDGTTGLFGGGRVPKCHPRIECYGTVDELNAALGMAAAAAQGEMLTAILAVQNDLFTIGSHLATPEDSPVIAALPDVEQALIERLESQIDAADEVLPPLRQFILPGGTDLSARLHVARTICRRAERLVVAFAQEGRVEPTIIVYLNRLSDWLFVYARLANHQAAAGDIPWTKP